jgi:ferredoxin
MNGYSIEIDRTLCSGFGACVEVAPHLIRLDDKGKAFVVLQDTEEEVALEAASCCPMGAISVYRSAGG